MSIWRKGKSGADRRRLADREEGQKLVFAGAQDYARRLGKIREGRNACYEQSAIGRGGYTLRTAEGTLIQRVPLVQAREMLRFRRALARELLKDLKEDVLKESTLDVERRQIRVQPERLRALAWAIGTGRRFPYEEGVKRRQWILWGLLLCGVVPGVIYYYRRVRPARRQYQDDLRQLVDRWRMQGKPDPPHSFFLLYDLD
ncbi:MAG: hypothetical protein KFB97_13135 [Cyanobium sp. M30B3]|nr:MAG: hypothetical protein KFB97_13135 [Cyanobium sp. M30B3]